MHSMKDSISIREVALEDIMDVHESIPEFMIHFPYTLETFRERTKGKRSVSFIATINEEPVGYIVGYERDKDGSFYCWMASVKPAFRRKGVLAALMEHQEEWARAHGYHMLKIKTRNHRREMLAFLVKQGFHFTEVTPHEKVEDHRIHLQKNL